METPTNKSVWGNRIFYTVFVLLIIGSVGFTYWRIVIQKDYQIVAETSCNPITESCFYYEGVVCDGSDSTCVPEDAYDYKMISKKAANIYTCEQTTEKVGCGEELSCTEGELDCTYTLCDAIVDENCSITQVMEPIIETASSTEISL